jgi:large subunit ribosomal protein L3
MAGHMGDCNVTIQNLRVVKTDPERGLIMIKGAVPGAKGGWVTLKDAIKKKLPDNIPYPTSSEQSIESKASELDVLEKSDSSKNEVVESSKTDLSTDKQKDLEPNNEN